MTINPLLLISVNSPNFFQLIQLYFYIGEEIVLLITFVAFILLFREEIYVAFEDSLTLSLNQHRERLTGPTQILQNK